MDKELSKRLKALELIRKDMLKEEKVLSKEIIEAIKQTIKNNPALEGFRWQQYTPSFNDGDVCEFGVYGPHFKFDKSIMGNYKSDYSDDDGYIDEYWMNREFFEKNTDILNFKQIKVVEKAVEDVQELFWHISNFQHSLQEMFGDGYQITVTKDGIESEEYNHD